MFALHLVLTIGLFVAVSMIWHLWQIVSLHNQRADWEWERINQKLDALIAERP